LYAAKFTSAAIQNLKELPKNVRSSIKSDLDQKVLRDPVGCSEALTRALTGFRSFHSREYRIVFRVFADLKTIAVVGIGKKSGDPDTDIYRRLEQLSESGKLTDQLLKSVRFLSSS